MNVDEPLVKFDSKNRASLVSMSVKTRGRSRRRRKSSPRLVKGRLSLRVRGFPGVQRVAPSHLVQYLPISRLRTAALQHLKRTKKFSVVNRGRKGRRKTRKGRKRSRRRSKK